MWGKLLACDRNGYGRAVLQRKNYFREPVEAARWQPVRILKQKHRKKDSTGGANVTEKDDQRSALS
jgi:hypothetical protein